jgi:hypothetical protein
MLNQPIKATLLLDKVANTSLVHNQKEDTNIQNLLAATTPTGRYSTNYPQGGHTRKEISQKRELLDRKHMRPTHQTHPKCKISYIRHIPNATFSPQTFKLSPG